VLEKSGEVRGVRKVEVSIADSTGLHLSSDPSSPLKGGIRGAGLGSWGKCNPERNGKASGGSTHKIKPLSPDAWTV